jgi:hypothetical protein
MISAAEFRKLQTESLAQKKVAHEEAKTKRETEQKARFAKACDEYQEVILDEVQAALKHVREKGLRYNYIMLEHTYLIKDVKGFSYTTLLYGFWNKDGKKFDDSIFKDSEVTKPFDRAVEELAKHGYKLENVSDPTRSKRLYIKLSWADEEPSKPSEPSEPSAPIPESA